MINQNMDYLEKRWLEYWNKENHDRPIMSVTAPKKNAKRKDSCCIVSPLIMFFYICIAGLEHKASSQTMILPCFTTNEHPIVNVYHYQQRGYLF